MPDETGDVSVSLKRYIETLIDLKIENINERFKSDGVARELALRELEHWKNTHNEFQRRIDRMSETLVTNDKLADRIDPLAERITKLEQWQARAFGASAIIVAVAGILGALLVKLVG